MIQNANVTCATLLAASTLRDSSKLGCGFIGSSRAGVETKNPIDAALAILCCARWRVKERAALTAIAQCARCDGLGLLELLDWSRSRRVRIYALAGIERAAVALFERNRERGSCDLSRADREVEALFWSAGAVERVLALDVEGNAVLAAASRPSGLSLPSAPWRERLLEEADASWFMRLGLEKSAT